MGRQWILVADESRARVFGRDGPTDALEAIETRDHPMGRLREQEINTDRPGRSFDSFGGGRHAMEGPVNAERTEARRFANELAGFLEHGRINGAYAELVLIAPPVFLGALRKELSNNVQKLVVAELAKELTQFSLEDIEAHLKRLT